MKPLMLLAVAAGGAAGAVARYAITHLTQQRLATPFPLGTLIANLVGCLAIGFCFVWFEQRIASPTLRAAVQVGLIGALTTFSTYCIESLSLISDKHYAYAALNLVGSVLAGLALAYLGMVAARTLLEG